MKLGERLDNIGEHVGGISYWRVLCSGKMADEAFFELIGTVHYEGFIPIVKMQLPLELVWEEPDFCAEHLVSMANETAAVMEAA